MHVSGLELGSVLGIQLLEFVENLTQHAHHLQHITNINNNKYCKISFQIKNVEMLNYSY